MTPSSQLQTNLSSSSNSPLYSRVATMGNKPDEETQSGQVDQKNQPSKADQLVTRFSALNGMFQDLVSSFPGGEDEVKNVQTALANWLNKAAKQTNESGEAAS